MQRLTQKAFGFLRPSGDEQQIGQRQLAACIVRHRIQPLAEHRLGFLQIAQLLQDGAGFIIGFGIVGLEPGGVPESLGRLGVMFQPSQGGAVTEGQHGFARFGGPGAGKKVGGLLMTLLMHSNQPGQMQQFGVGGEAVQQGGQDPIGGVGIARPQHLVGQKQGLLEILGCLESGHRHYPIGQPGGPVRRKIRGRYN